MHPLGARPSRHSPDRSRSTCNYEEGSDGDRRARLGCGPDARRRRRHQLRWFRSGLAADDKGGGAGYDPVTEADRGVEDLLRERLSEEFPDHEIVGEERGAAGPQGRFRWLIDPIDGTKAFVSGSPLWGILLGLSVDGQPAAGWMHQPYLGEKTAIGVEG